MLTTATPHSGIEESFRSLLGLLNRAFDKPEQSEIPRNQLTPHFVQRKRSDLKNWLDVDTPFPERESVERIYGMSDDYFRLYQDILEYCREYVATDGEENQRHRVKYWAALSILRCVLSSPRAAKAVLENRKASETYDSIDGLQEEVFSQQIMDSAEEDQATDYVPTAALDDEGAGLGQRDIRTLNNFLRRATALEGPVQDRKLSETARAVSDLIRDGYSPIVYCRFIQTARYVAEHLETILKSVHPSVQVKAVTGDDGDSEKRKETVLALAQEPVRVLVATDCLSEGIKSPRTLQCRNSLRPSLEPEPSRTARGSR